MIPRIITTSFAGESLRQADRLLAAYQASAQAAGVPLAVHELAPDAVGPLARSLAPGLLHRYRANTIKLRHWQQLIEQAAGPIMLTDCDMLVLRDPRDAFADREAWDVALTRYDRPGPVKWFNAGVVLCRPTPGARKFMTHWRQLNDAIAADPRSVAHHQALQTFCGINQAALALLLAREDRPYRIKWLECAQFNCCDACWPTVDIARIRLLHIKGKLRKACLTGRPFKRPELVRLWKCFDGGKVTHG